jgi:hypothetical protein
MKKNGILFMFCLSHIISQAQTILTCTITDCKTNEPIPYVHVGIAGKNTGTITNEAGLFTLRVPDSLILENLTISSVGYETQRIVISKEKTALQLCPQTIQLAEVVIRPKKEKTLGLSRKGNSMLVFAGALKGGEMAEKIVNKGVFFVRKIGVNVTLNDNDTLKFRVSFYKVQDNNIGEVINTKPIYWRVLNKETGWLYLDLPENVVIEGDFFVSLEVVEVRPLGTKTVLGFACGLTSKKMMYNRPVSQGYWQVIKLCQMSLTVIGNY